MKFGSTWVIFLKALCSRSAVIKFEMPKGMVVDLHWFKSFVFFELV